MNIPDKWPWIAKTTWNMIWKSISKVFWVAWMWKVLASTEEWAWMKFIDWLIVPADIVWFMLDFKEKINYLVEVWQKWWETTINQAIEWWKMFLEPTAEYIKNVWSNFELFDEWFLKIASQNEELWWNMVDTLLAFLSVWGVYMFLIPFLLKMVTYKDCPDMSQRIRSKITESINKNK